MTLRLVCGFILLVVSAWVRAEDVSATCNAIEAKLSSVKTGDCNKHSFSDGGSTQKANQLLYLNLPSQAAEVQKVGKVLLIGGIHGDEFSSVSIVFRWLDILQRLPNRQFDWLVVPAANPDGLLNKPGTRQNASGIDLNRNFPTQNWLNQSTQYWLSRNKNPRRFPGHEAASEIETRWLMSLIKDFNPDVIIAVHAPYSLVDFDGPPKAPSKLGALVLNQLGIYPGSLGNYGSRCLGKQVVTLELPSAGVMPSDEEIKRMWRDLVQWLVNNQRVQKQQEPTLSKERQGC